ncbi:MAG: NAD-dependent epimerase/dehydratase family protein [Chloroflexi bacterium]|nr:NAD-dependent epimerase/dehydratase family protein [Chloroflexota bacterium]
MFQNKTVLITGGTGSLGNSLVRKIMTGDLGIPKKVIIFSRDEDKQYLMRLEWKNIKVATDDVLYHDAEGILDFRIGDIREYESILRSVKEAEIVIHAAALKQVPVCEYFPYESVKTNLLGVQNIIRAIAENETRVETVIAVSTDKACKPVNVYGMCKAIQERLVIEANLRCPNTKFICARYGNVAASRGSVILLFKEQIKNGGPVTITTKEMTRFLLTLNTACNIIFDAIRLGKAGDIYVPDLPSAKIVDLAEVMIGGRKIDIEYTGIRPGEKIHEILVSEEEISRTVKKGNYYVIRPILQEIWRGEIDMPALAKELSSADRTMSKSELKDFLENERLLKC